MKMYNYNSSPEPDLLLKVINETSNLIVITNATGEIIWANNSFVKTSEYSLEEAAGKKPGHLLNGKDKDMAEVNKIRECIQKEVPVEGELLNYSRTGKKYWVHYNIHPVKDEKGKLVKFFSIQSDITNLKKIQEEVIEKRIERLSVVASATIKGQEDKQNEIGRELHDNVNQLLAASKMNLGLALKNKNIELISLSMNHIQTAIDEIRQLTHSLVAPGFRDTSLASGLEILVKESRTSACVNINTSKLNESTIDPNIKLALYRIAQEQLNNITKHAQASSIIFFAESDQKNIRLYIEDNGIGFDMAKKNTGIGIHNIHNRAASFYGKVIINSSPGHGCKLEVVIPVTGSV
jgi:two-component system sensor histidine kinase UhpB